MFSHDKSKQLVVEGEGAIVLAWWNQSALHFLRVCSCIVTVFMNDVKQSTTCLSLTSVCVSDFVLEIPKFTKVFDCVTDDPLVFVPHVIVNFRNNHLLGFFLTVIDNLS